MKSAYSQPHCLVCDRLAAGGVQFAGASLCPTCEQEVVEARVEKPGYAWLVSKFRTFWEGLAEAAASSD